MRDTARFSLWIAAAAAHTQSDAHAFYRMKPHSMLLVTDAALPTCRASKARQITCSGITAEAAHVKSGAAGRSCRGLCSRVGGERALNSLF